MCPLQAGIFQKLSIAYSSFPGSRKYRWLPPRDWCEGLRRLSLVRCGASGRDNLVYEQRDFSSAHGQQHRSISRASQRHCHSQNWCIGPWNTSGNELLVQGFKDIFTRRWTLSGGNGEAVSDNFCVIVISNDYGVKLLRPLVVAAISWQWKRLLLTFTGYGWLCAVS